MEKKIFKCSQCGFSYYSKESAEACADEDKEDSVYDDMDDLERLEDDYED